MNPNDLLPKGLQEYLASIKDHEYGEEFIPRLLDLPENGLSNDVNAYLDAVDRVKSAIASVKLAKRKAAELADKVFGIALDHWSIKDIQEATGYDEE